MTNNSTKSSEDDLGLDITFTWTSQGVLGVFHVVTSVWLTSFFRLFYRRIEISHPVFAVLFQDTVVMALCNAWATASLPVLALMSRFQLWLDMSSRLAVSSIQFHQTSWFVASCTRVYLTRKPNHADSDSLKKVCTLLVWLLTLVLAIIFYVVRTSMIPGGFVSDNFIPKDEDEVHIRYLVLLAALLITNLPDYLSIIIYVVFYYRSNSIEPEHIIKDEEPFGGIYVGESVSYSAASIAPTIGEVALATIESHKPHSTQEEQGQEADILPGAMPDVDSVQGRSLSGSEMCLEPNLNQLRLDSTSNREEVDLAPSIEVAAPDAPSALPAPKEPAASVITTQQQEIKCAVQALRTHALTCLMDFFLLALVFLPVNEASVLTLYLASCAVAYWLPVLAAVHNFGKLRNMIVDVCREFFF